MSESISQTNGGRSRPIRLTRGDGIPHGADYYPEQWLDAPEILERDIDLMRTAGITAVTLGVFAWSMLEPAEGQYSFDWLHERINRLHQAEIQVVLATPTGAPPRWLTKAYPEVLRTGQDRRRNRPGRRLNFCPSSVKYRKFVAGIVTRLAHAFGQHPALALWHVNNELAWSCHCDSCQAQFRLWLQRRYSSLDVLNRAWNTPFWSARFAEWEEIESPALLDGMEHQRHEDITMPGLTLDWHRFSSWLNADLLRHEIACVRGAGSTVPVTTNTWGIFGDFDSRDLAPLLDVAAVDSYPAYKALPGDEYISSQYAFSYDAYRAFKRQPFLLLETTPGMTFGPVGAKLKRPGQHRLACLQAVAHGADSVCYFQWRQSVGGAEQFHSAVVPHTGEAQSRTYREVAQLGGQLKTLGALVGTVVPAETAVVFDREIHWAMLAVHGFHATAMNYPATCLAHYDALHTLSVPMDVIHTDAQLDAYRLVVAPMLFMLRPGVAERLHAFVERGGCLVGTYLSGYVDQYNSCFRESVPGPLRELFGIESEDVDVLVDGPISSTGWLAQLPIPPRPLIHNTVAMDAANALALDGNYAAGPFCEIIRCRTALPLARYAGEFYAGIPAVTINRLGRGIAVFLGAQLEPRFLTDIYSALATQQTIRRSWSGHLPPSVRVNERIGGDGRYLFFQNYGALTVEVDLGSDIFSEVETGERCMGPLTLHGYGAVVLRDEAHDR